MRPGTLRIGLASPRVATTREDGLATAGRVLTEAAAQGAAIVCFPETYLPGYRGLDVLTPPPDQRAQERALLGVRAVARQHRVAVIMPMEWASPAGLLNLAVVVNANGTIQGYQTKNQLAPEEEPHYIPGATLCPARAGTQGTWAEKEAWLHRLDALSHCFSPSTKPKSRGAHQEKHLLCAREATHGPGAPGHSPRRQKDDHGRAAHPIR